MENDIYFQIAITIMKKLAILIITCVILTVIQYVSVTSPSASICVCPPAVDGIEFPRLIPWGCGDCGIGLSFSQFLSQIITILKPAITLTAVYLTFIGIGKYISNKKSPK